MAAENKDIQKQEAHRTGDIERTRDARVYIPRTDIYERQDAIVVTAEMPGVDNESVDINLDRNELTITGHVKKETPDGYTLAYAEYNVGDYQRSFRILEEIATDKIEATMKNGVLKVVLPRAPEAKPKKIAVKTG